MYKTEITLSLIYLETWMLEVVFNQINKIFFFILYKGWCLGLIYDPVNGGHSKRSSKLIVLNYDGRTI